jgi:Flp pilus assembly protein TadG
MSGAEEMRRLRGMLKRQDGGVALEFALIAPLLFAVTLGALEIAFIAYDFHAATEATRRGVRQAITETSVATLSHLGANPITCSGSGDTVSCSSGSVRSSQSFTDIVNEIRAAAPFVSAENVRVSYRASGVTVDAAGSFVTPLVTVSLVGVRHDFFALKLIPGMPTSMTYPGFESTRLAATTPAG